MPRSRGFTLLELLVVLVLMGLLTAAGMTTLQYTFDAETADKHAERLAALVALASEEALLTGRELGMRIDDNGYSFLYFSEREQAWTTISEAKTFRPRQLPEHIEVALELEGRTVELGSAGEDDAGDADDEAAGEADSDGDFATDPPQVMFFSSGQSTPFRLDLMDTRDNSQWRLKVDLLGRVEREKLE